MSKFGAYGILCLCLAYYTRQFLLFVWFKKSSSWFLWVIFFSFLQAVEWSLKLSLTLMILFDDWQKHIITYQDQSREQTSLKIGPWQLGHETLCMRMYICFFWLNNKLSIITNCIIFQISRKRRMWTM